MITGQSRSTVLLQLLGFILVVTSPFWLLALYYGDPYSETTNEFAVLPMLTCIALTATFRVSKKDRLLGHLMFVGLLLKLAACAASLYIALRVYQGSADAAHYITAGRHIAGRYESLGTLQFYEPYWSTNFVRNLTGLICIILGPSMVNATVIYALLGFWGQYLAFRAFRTAYPHGDERLAGMLLFLLPSIVFWPAAIGKDSLALLFIGMTIYGYARLDRSGKGRGLFLAVLGLGGILLVRPHVAAMLAAAFVVPYVFARGKPGLKTAAFRFASVVVLLVTAAYLIRGAQQFVGASEIADTTSALEMAQRKSNFGSSAFGTASPLARVLAAPVLFFRPFPWEIHNLQAAIAGGESLLLLLIVWHHRASLLNACRRLRQSAFTFFVLIFLVEFCAIFSAAISNFGLLARQRVMGVPFLLILISAMPAQVRAWGLLRMGTEGDTVALPRGTTRLAR